MPSQASCARLWTSASPTLTTASGCSVCATPCSRVGDCFLEVVSPTRADTAAGRYLERQGGDTGYMAMVQVADAAAARARLHESGVRIVWDFAEADIVDLHLHPRDVPGALLALDQAEPVGSWRWGGPGWIESVPAHPPGGLRELVVAVDRPAEAAARWGQVIGVPASGDRAAAR